MKLFWLRGYSAASLSMLLDVMDIGKSSFYAAFTDKRGLYIEALNLFGNRTRDKFIKLKQDNHSLDAVQLFFEDTLSNVSQRRRSLGCMMVNTILELSDVDQGLSDLAAKKLAEIEVEFARAFADDIIQGRLNTSQRPEDMAALVMTINQGLRVSSRKKCSNIQLNANVKTVMEMLSHGFNRT